MQLGNLLGNWKIMVPALIAVIGIAGYFYYIEYSNDQQAKLFTTIDFVDQSKNYSWFKALYQSDFGTGHTNELTMSIANVTCEYGHCFYGVYFSKKINEFCNENGNFTDCRGYVQKAIDEGNFEQMAQELNYTLDQKVTSGCYDNGTQAFCKNQSYLNQYFKLFPNGTKKHE